MNEKAIFEDDSEKAIFQDNARKAIFEDDSEIAVFDVIVGLDYSYTDYSSNDYL